MWDSLDGLSKLSTFLQWTAAALALLAAIIVIGNRLVSARIGTLQAIKDKETQQEIARLEDFRKGRVLTQEQVDLLCSDLLPLKKMKIYLMGIQGDQESIRFANQLKDIFISVGWSIDGVWEDILVSGPGKGILVRQNKLETKNIGENIVESLNRLNLQARLIKMPNNEIDGLQIIVGGRP